MTTKVVDFFTDPILAAPMWATMLMCLSSSLIGILIVVRRRALLGEALSHTTYPGIAMMIFFAADYLGKASWLFPLLVIVGAFLSATVGMRLIFLLERRFKVSPDSSLCFVLSTFLGIGVLLASRLQFSHPVWVQKVQMFLYGQAATIISSHVWIYAGLTTLIATTLYFFFPVISVTFFDREYAKVCRIRTRLVGILVQVLLISAIVIGIRSVGVLMMSGMLIAPAAAARMVTKRFSHMFIAGGFFGVVSGVLGNMASVYLTDSLQETSSQFRISFPTGPMILIVAVLIAVTLLFFAKNGLVWRALRRRRFRRVCNQENILKLLYKANDAQVFTHIKDRLCLTYIECVRGIASLWFKGYLISNEGKWRLALSGEKRARRIIRVHRLWEVYLVSEIGVNAEDVHKSAEDMEHIITPKIERELAAKLGHPEKDPHDQLIPQEEGGSL